MAASKTQKNNRNAASAVELTCLNGTGASLSSSAPSPSKSRFARRGEGPLARDAQDLPVAVPRDLSALSDEELVALCRKNSNRAWATLVRRYRRLIYAVPRRAGLPDHVVEDIFHETYAKLAERISSLEEGNRVRAWMVTTARRLTIDAIRSKSARKFEDADDALANRADEQELASEAMERLEDHHRIRQALGRVDARSKALLTMLFYHGSDSPPSYETISRELRIPVGAIGPTRARALKKLLVAYQALEQD